MHSRLIGRFNANCAGKIVPGVRRRKITAKRDFSGKAAGDKNGAEIYLGGEYASRKR